MVRGSKWWAYVLGLSVWIGAVLLCVVQYRSAMQGRHPGFDLQPLYQAAQSAVHGHSVYDTPMLFVYPPTTAIFALPLTFWSFHIVLSHGSTLTGDFATYNLSLHALGEAHDLAAPVTAAARVLVVAAVAVALVLVVRRRRVWDVPAVAWLSMLLLLALFLAGSLSEGHYLLTVVPGIVAVIARSTSLPGRLLAGAGLALLAVPPLGFDNLQTQALYAGIEVLLFVSAFLATVRERPAPPPEAVPAPRTAEPDSVRTLSPEPA